MKFSVLINSIKENILKLKTKNRRLSTKAKIDFLYQFGTLLNSGIPITNALKIMIYQTENKNIKTIIEVILDDLNKGISLKESILKFPLIFKQFDYSIIEMGELTGKVGDSIEIIKEKEEKSKELKSKILGAFIYPIIITSLSIGMITIFILYVIPKITDMYKDAKVNLPKLTQFVIDLSDFLQKNIVILCISLSLIIFLIYTFKTHKKTKIYFDKYIVRMPIFGILLKKKILAIFTSSLGTLLKNGVIINKSLEISAGVVSNDFYKKEIEKIIQGISSGEDFSKMLGIDNIKEIRKYNTFPMEIASIVKIGEQTGKLPELLIKISEKYNKEIDNVVKNLSTAIEPLVIVFVGSIIGTLIMAIMLPFFNMVNVIGN
ncbi:hypothetical protein EOM39_03665 [Candidatus Gracilibacteria bacterium]|nr:hypothetical protein [Candidatus Gracilibacteria bacterium]